MWKNNPAAGTFYKAISSDTIQRYKTIKAQIKNYFPAQAVEETYVLSYMIHYHMQMIISQNAPRNLHMC